MPWYVKACARRRNLIHLFRIGFVGIIIIIIFIFFFFFFIHVVSVVMVATSGGVDIAKLGKNEPLAL